MMDSKIKILVVDDNVDIHHDFRKILENQNNQIDQGVSSLRKRLFSDKNENKTGLGFQCQIDSAYQGQEGLAMVKAALEAGQPYALAFVDIRMPPGWDGVETIQKIWEVDSDMEIVICSAYSDYSWEDFSEKLTLNSQFLILKKPFDPVEIKQFAAGLGKKWLLKKQVKRQIVDLEGLTNDLEQSLLLTNTTLNSTQEGILVLDQHQNIVKYNQNFLKQWGLSELDMTNPDSKSILDRLSQQTDDPEFFIQLVSTLAREGNQITKEWRLPNNRVFEIYVHPLIQNQVCVGNVCSFRDVSAQKEMELAILHQATHDHLTGLPNRVLLSDRINQAMLQAKRYQHLVGVLIFDLDHFKEINDSLGHHAGDELLISVTQSLKSLIREGDTLIRLGGDEFVIILAAQSKLELLAARAREFIHVTGQPKMIAKTEFRVTTSIGISVYPKDGSDPETLLRNADSALYRAKEAGRNHYVFYEAEFNEKTLARVELISALRTALDSNEFVLHYQPLIDVKSKQIIGVEALLRWNHPKFSSISPQFFIPVIEETGLIIPIGNWILKTACQQGKIWHDDNQIIKVAVNVSVLQFTQRNFVEVVKEILAETQFNPHYLELEITESVILKSVDESVRKMTELKKMGVAITIDDFGTGYSALSSLKYFPFDKVKIDKSFIQGISSETKDDSIVDAIISITKQFGITVLAEGVEKGEQFDFIRDHACNQAQGYYFSKPIDGGSLTNLLLSQTRESVTQ